MLKADGEDCLRQGTEAQAEPEAEASSFCSVRIRGSASAVSTEERETPVTSRDPLFSVGRRAPLDDFPILSGRDSHYGR